LSCGAVCLGEGSATVVADGREVDGRAGGDRPGPVHRRGDDERRAGEGELIDEGASAAPEADEGAPRGAGAVPGDVPDHTAYRQVGGVPEGDDERVVLGDHARRGADAPDPPVDV